jgi:hypothetical protein
MRILGAGGGGLPVVARTPAAGVPLVNGTPTLLQWAVPNDGQLHVFDIAAGMNVTSLLTGGATQINWTTFGSGKNTGIFNGGEAANIYFGGGNGFVMVCDPGTIVSITQASAMTAGAAQFAAAILGT